MVSTLVHAIIRHFCWRIWGVFMDAIAEIRLRHLVFQESIRSIAHDLKLFRPTVRKHCRTQGEPVYRCNKQPTPMLGTFQ